MNSLRPPILLAVLGVATLLTLAFCPTVGFADLSLSHVLNGHEPQTTIFLSLRLPRTLLAAITGGALAVSGALFQTILRNELATPFTLGVASGASLGATVAIHLGLSTSLLGFINATPFFALLGSLAVLALVLLLARLRPHEPSTLLLSGVTLSFLCSALILLVQFLSDFTQTHQMIRWLMGGLDTIGFTPILSTLPLLLPALAFSFLRADLLNHFATGDLLAISRGVPIHTTRLQFTTAASLMTASTLAWTGPIGFVGLIVPHALRRLHIHDARLLLPTSFLAGATLLPICDTFARTLLAPTELPVGILTALLGAPFFLLILFRPQRNPTTPPKP